MEPICSIVTISVTHSLVCLSRNLSQISRQWNNWVYAPHRFCDNGTNGFLLSHRYRDNVADDFFLLTNFVTMKKLLVTDFVTMEQFAFHVSRIS